MSKDSGKDTTEKSGGVRRKPQRPSPLSPTFAAARQPAFRPGAHLDEQEAGLLQRQCSCGTHTIAGSTCNECRGKKGGDNHRKLERPGQEHRWPGLKTPAPALTTPGHYRRPLIQAKLSVSAAGDRYEQEADRVADMVIRGQRLVSSSPHGNGNKNVSPVTPRISTVLARVAGAEEEDLLHGEGLVTPQQKIQRAATGSDGQVSPGSPPAVHWASSRTGTGQVSDDLESRLNRSKAGGLSLPPSVQTMMEGAFGRDFSRVRVHTGATAVQLSRDLQAQAFTYGRHIYFNQGKYDPGTTSGSHLLAHELTHVVQQGAAGPRQVVDDGAEPAGSIGTPVVDVAQTQRQVIQRLSRWQAGPVHEVNNLASALVNGTSVGVTWPTMNGTNFWSAADALRLFNQPEIAYSSQASGEVQAELTSTGNNVVSFDETVLSPGPWRVQTDSGRLYNLFPSLNQCAMSQAATFQALGQPDDRAMYEANRRHEDRHATDHEQAFNNSIAPWDERLTQVFLSSQTFRGPDEATATANLYNAVGSTPQQVTADFFNRCVQAVVAYHNTAQGGGVSWANPQANADCTQISAEATNPS